MPHELLLPNGKNLSVDGCTPRPPCVLSTSPSIVGPSHVSALAEKHELRTEKTTSRDIVTSGNFRKKRAKHLTSNHRNILQPFNDHGCEWARERSHVTLCQTDSRDKQGAQRPRTEKKNETSVHPLLCVSTYHECLGVLADISRQDSTTCGSCTAS